MKSTTPDSTLTASPREQLAFSLTYRAMWYWYAERQLMEKELAYKDSVIATYAKATGVQAYTIKTLEETLELTEAVNQDAARQLPKLTADVAKFKGRSKRRFMTIVIGIPVAFGTGYGIGKLTK